MNEALLRSIYGSAPLATSTPPNLQAQAVDNRTEDQLPIAYRVMKPALGIKGKGKKKTDPMQKALLAKKQQIDPSQISAGAREIMKVYQK